jgi:hypothetical protein
MLACDVTDCRAIGADTQYHSGATNRVEEYDCLLRPTADAARAGPDLGVAKDFTASAIDADTIGDRASFGESASGTRTPSAPVATAARAASTSPRDLEFQGDSLATMPAGRAPRLLSLFGLQGRSGRPVSGVPRVNGSQAPRSHDIVRSGAECPPNRSRCRLFGTAARSRRIRAARGARKYNHGWSVGRGRSVESRAIAVKELQASHFHGSCERPPG